MFDFDAYEENDDRLIVAGYPALFNSLSLDLGGFRETIERGAFAKSLTDDVVGLFNHDPNLILGRTTAGTLTLKEDSTGLYMELIPPRVGIGPQVVEALQRTDLRHGSFGFRVIADHWTASGAESIRTLIQVQLFDVSIVTRPAYPATRVGLGPAGGRHRSSDADLDLQRRRLRLAELS